MPAPKKTSWISRSPLRRHWNPKDGHAVMSEGVVIAMAGVAFFGLWWMLSSHLQNRQIETAQRQIATIVKRTRDLYAAKGKFANPKPHQVTAEMVKAGVYPREMFEDSLTGAPQTPWRTTLNFFVDSANSFWLINAGGVTAEVCGRILGHAFDPKAPGGLLKVWRSDNVLGYPHDILKGGMAVTNATQAKEYCNNVGSNGSTGFGLLYALKP